MKSYENLQSFVLGINVVFDRAGSPANDPRMDYFEKIANSPYPVFPNKGEYEIQPIARKDISSAIVGLLDDNAVPLDEARQPSHIEYIPALGPYPMTIAEIVNCIRLSHQKKPTKVKNLPDKVAKILTKGAQLTNFHVANETFLEMAKLSQHPDSGVTGSCRRLEEASGVKLSGLREMYGLQPLVKEPEFTAEWLDNPADTMLVTGGTGMVGKRIIEYAKENGFKVICITRNPESKENDGTVHYVKADLASPAFHSADVWEEILQKHGVTHVVEAAGTFDGKPDYLHKVNVKAPMAIAEAAEKVGVKKYIQISSLNSRNVTGNPIWDGYRELADYFENERQNLNWVEVQPTHIYASKPGESHVPYHLMAALKYHIEFKEDTMMQPIHVRDLAEGIVKLAGNEEGIHEHIAAVGPSQFGHNEFLDKIQACLGIAGEDSTVTVGSKTARRLGELNEWANKKGLINFLPALTKQTIEFNLFNSTGDAGYWEQITGTKLKTLKEHFRENQSELLEDLFIKHNRLLRFMHKVDPEMPTKIDRMQADDWMVVLKNGIHFIYKDKNDIPDEVEASIEILNDYFHGEGRSRKIGRCVDLNRGPSIGQKFFEGVASPAIFTSIEDFDLMAKLIDKLNVTPEWIDREQREAQTAEITGFIDDILGKGAGASRKR